MEDEKNLQDPADVVDERETREIDNRENAERDSGASSAEEGGGDVIIIK